MGMNWASEGFEFVYISVVDFAWRLVGEGKGEPEEEGSEPEPEAGIEMEEQREREGEEYEVGELVDEVDKPMRAKERRVVRSSEGEGEEGES